jgi:hypothetical protein
MVDCQATLPVSSIACTTKGKCFMKRLHARPGFKSSEHLAIGNRIVLSALSDDISQRLYLDNGLQLRFGEIVALAGDFFGVPDAPISFGTSDYLCQARFHNAFATLATRPSAVAEVELLLTAIQQEQDLILQAKANHESIQDLLKAIKLQQNKCYMVATKGRYLSLAWMNMDHFNDYAKIAYLAGHKQALAMALSAHHCQDLRLKQQMLHKAYSYEAYACHFLTDLFAAGHMRTPRTALLHAFKNHPLAKEIAGLLALCQHYEDGQHGLMVTLPSAEPLFVQGDGFLFEEQSCDYRQIIEQSIQTMVDDIAIVYDQGQLHTYPEQKLALIVPQASANNFSPLFHFNTQEQALFVRQPVDDLNAQSYQLLTPLHAAKVLAYFAELGVIDKIQAYDLAQLFNLDQQTISCDLTFFQPLRESSGVGQTVTKSNLSHP